MNLTLLDNAHRPEPLASWPLPVQAPFVGSEDLERLKRDLQRYARGEVRGRSYLIAGHRGAGKTALTVRAIESVASGMLRQSVLETGSELPDGPFQRPLLVKLHGPSMLEELPPPVVPSLEAKQEKPALADPAADADAGKVEKPVAAPAPPPPPPIAAGVHAALVQITIGLYRALAGEAATGFRAHALQRDPARRGEAAEMAAQMELNLDSGADPSMLRRFWSALGRLPLGVLWPKTADKTLIQHDMEDQGLREVIALATAAQAFQVCSGRIQYTTTSKESLARIETSELKGSSDLKDAFARLGTLGLGAVTGVALFALPGGSAIGAAAAGAATWLIGTLTLSWSRSSKRTNDRSVDYSFIRDFAPATLDRDLPVVIARVREAGLAPVFVIDELDKVRDAADAIAVLVGRLKHLIADYGFFCFLVNRDCYEAIEARVRKLPYPAEHTLFSQRLLLRPEPGPMLTFLIGRLGYDPADPQADLARAAFALNTMHESRLNLTDMTRLLTRITGSGDELGTTAEMTKQRRLVLATVQVAIDHVLGSPALVDRMDENASFAQLALDALYYPSRRWRAGDLLIDPSPEALKAHLEQRLQPDEGSSSKDKPTVSDGDLDLLQDHLIQFLVLLGDMTALRNALGDVTAIPASQSAVASELKLAQIPPANLDQICVAESDGRFRFLFTPDGDSANERQGRLTGSRREEARRLLNYESELRGLLADAGISLDELAFTPLLTGSFSSSIDLARTGLEAALRRVASDPEVESDFDLLERHYAQLSNNGEALAALILLVRSLARDTSESFALLPRIQRLIRFVAPPSSWIEGLAFPRRKLPSDVDKLKQWRNDFVGWLLPAPGDDTRPRGTEYQQLADPLRRFFDVPQAALYTPDYRALMAAARGHLPAAALSVQFDEMRLHDWSSLALAAMPSRSSPAAAPYWMLVAALRGLGFGRGALLELADRELADSLATAKWQTNNEAMDVATCFDLAASFASGAPDPRPPGLLVLESGDTRYGQERPIERRGLLVLNARAHDDHFTPLQWLTALGIFSGQADARPETAKP